MHLTNHFASKLHNHSPGRLVVGFSGGVDSSVLLHLAQQWASQRSDAQRPVTLLAVHLNHGYSFGNPGDAWQAHCRRVCRQLGVEFTAQRLMLSAGGDLENRARQARYAAFEELCTTGDLLLLGHQRDDCCETLLSKLHRGAALSGLLIPEQRRLNCAALLLRPLLDIPKSTLITYARHTGLDWLDDPGNLTNDLDWLDDSGAPADGCNDAVYGVQPGQTNRAVNPHSIQSGLSDLSDLSDLPDLPDLPDRPDLPDQSNRPNQSDQPEQPGHTNRAAGADNIQPGLSDLSDRPNLSDLSDLPNLPGLPGQPNQSDLPGRPTANDRAKMRAGLFPALQAIWPNWQAGWSHSLHFLRGDAQALDWLLSKELAAQPNNGSLTVHGYPPLLHTRLVRSWLLACGIGMPGHKALHTQLHAMLARRGKAPQLWLRNHHGQPVALRAHRGRLWLVQLPLPASVPPQMCIWSATAPMQLDWGTLSCRVSPANPLQLRYGQVQATVRLPGRNHSSQLNKLWQASGVPPWERAATPQLYVDERLVALGDHPLCHAAQAWQLCWKPAWRIYTP